MFSYIKKSLSGENQDSSDILPKQSKRSRSAELPKEYDLIGKEQKRKRISRGEAVEDDDIPQLKLPEETPAWGITLLEIIQKDMKSISEKLDRVEVASTVNTRNLGDMEKKLKSVEKQNVVLKEENCQLKEHLLDMEYRQRRNNLIFDGIVDTQGESDLDCIGKLRYILKGIPGLDMNTFKIE